MSVHSESNYPKLLKAFQQFKWISRDKTVHRLSEMSNHHLYNTIKMLEKRLGEGMFSPKLDKLMVAWLFRMQAEVHMRGSLGRIDDDGE